MSIIAGPLTFARFGVFTLATVGLAACAGSSNQPALPIQSSTTVAADEANVREAVTRELEALGFTVNDRKDGTLRGMGENAPGQGFASCRTIRTAWRNGQDSVRYRRAQPVKEIVTVTVSFSSGDGTTTVNVNPKVTGVYDNRARGGSIDTGCPSNGKLEADLLAAADRTGAATGGDRSTG